MRVVTQRLGRQQYSFDFRESLVRLVDESIVCSCQGNQFIVGKFQTADRAQEVFQEMNDSYTDLFAEEVFYVPKE